MREQVKVVILDGNVTAKEINPFGVSPKRDAYKFESQFDFDYKKWEEKRNNLRTFKIATHYTDEKGFEQWTRGSITTLPKVGTIFEAEILENGEILLKY